MTHSYDAAMNAANEALNAAAKTLKSALRNNTPSQNQPMQNQPMDDVNATASQLKTPVRVRGGFVLAGMDSAGYHLLETSAGIQALYVLSHVGRVTGHGCEPVYLNQRFFDSLIED
ncbi:MAG: hypothetical protein QE263_03310 [Vampirovibrionales bacterium]|nr:hypothetical protein [Vampirovibrionales bacterium]